MKRAFYHLAVALVCGAMIVSCGGGNGGSKLKKNAYLGNLPALYDGYNIQNEALEKEAEKKAEGLKEGNPKDIEKAMKLFGEMMAKQETIKTEFEEKVKAELEKVAGKEIPVSYSAALTPWFTASATVVDYSDDPYLSLTVTTKEAMTVPAMKGYDYSVYFRLLGKDGTTLESGKGSAAPVKFETREQTFTAGQVVSEDYKAMGFNLDDYAASRVDFAGVEFITKEEYNAINN